MSTNLKTYEQQLFAKHHYRNLISAKSTLSHFHHPPDKITTRSRTLTPLDRYQYRQNNDKIRNKLTQIYQESTPRAKHPRQRKKKHNKSLTYTHTHKEQQKNIHDDNVKFYEKLITAKSTLGDFKERQKQLRKYSKITRKKINNPDPTLYQAFRELLVESKTGSKRSMRSSSALYCLKNRHTTQTNPNSATQENIRFTT